MTILPEDAIKLFLAVLIGGLIGAEREFRDKAAGFRTLIFICVGATLFTIFSVRIGGDEDAARIAANIVSGVGFLGAGVILRDAGRIMGLTTASTIWLTAALGMGIGGGHYLFSGVAAGVMLIVLWLFPRFEEWIDSTRDMRTYEVICPISPDKFAQLEVVFRQCGLHVKSHRQIKSGDEMICTWDAYGSPRNHDQLMEKLFADTGVRGFRF